MSKFDFSTPRRQSPKGVVLYFVMATQKIVRAAWPILLIYFFKNESFSEKVRMYALIAVAVIVLIMIAHAIFTYLRFYFYVENDEFKLSKGYLKRVNLSIPLDRIQTINSKQNLFQQWLKVVSVEIDTAGSATKELKIVALDKATADALSDLLNTNKLEEAGQTTSEETWDEKKVILKLGFGDLIKVGISENHIKSSLFILAFVSGIIDQLKDYFTATYEDTAEQAKNFLFGSDAFVYFMLIFLILLIGLAFSMVLIFLRYYDLKFSREGNKFHLQSGLLNKKSVSIPFAKIQVVSWRTNPIRKLMDFVTLNLSQATSSIENKKQAIDIPGCSSKHLQTVQAEIFPTTTEQGWSTHHSHRNYALRLWAAFGLLPTAIALIFGWMHWQVIVVASVWFVLSIGIAYLAFRKRYFRISPELIENSSGSVGQTFSRMFNFKVQSLKYKQTIFQRRRNLATLKIYTAGGKVLTMPYINSDIAFELYNYLLYVVESRERKWM
ncbi:MAG: PH domain-containing protein [Bacteroidales bacterium]|nr:PH domain-containing protein [Bacteroidales bacterium]MCF8456135.1 PH domain-containing protein [Bacteroidales bacterium]